MRVIGNIMPQIWNVLQMTAARQNSVFWVCLDIFKILSRHREFQALLREEKMYAV
jgi:hypothetical protein